MKPNGSLKSHAMLDNDQQLSDEEWEMREAHAFFGRAMFSASLLETALVHILLNEVFLKRVHTRYIATKRRDFDRQAYETQFDKFMADKEKLTMGGLLKEVCHLSCISDDLKGRLKAATERRNFLAHHYLRERCASFGSSTGRAKMLAELDSDAEMFDSLDNEVTSIIRSIQKKIGIDLKKLQPVVDEYIRDSTSAAS
jgi:hypothetical protein